MKSGVEKHSFSLPLLAIILAGIVFPLQLRADLVGFSYIDLNASFSGGVLTVVGQLTSQADVDRRESPTSTAHFSSSAPYLLSMNITNVTGSTANGNGTLTLTDINGDKITANITGTWEMIFAGLARFTGTLSNVQFVCSNNCIFEGASGSFPMIFSAPQPYIGIVQSQIADWFDTPFSGRSTVMDGLTFPSQASILTWQSVRTHGAGGPASIALNPTATGNGLSGPTVEPRNGGIQQITVDFDRQISLTATPALGITVTGRKTTYQGGIPTLGNAVGYAVSSVSMSGSSTLVINFNPGSMPDETSYTISLGSGVINEPIFGDHDCNIRSLYGDSSGDGRVELSDAILIKARAGLPAFSNPTLDIDLSNTIDQIDVLAAKARVKSPAHQALAP